MVWVIKKTVLNYGKYKLFKEKHKKEDPENAKFKKGTMNYQLNKYLLFVTEDSRMKLFDPMGYNLEFSY